MTRAEMKTRAREQLGNGIFRDPWLLAMVVCLIVTLLTGLAGTVLPGLGAVLISGPLLYGQIRLFLRQARSGLPMEVTEVFQGFRDDLGGIILIGLLTTLFTLLWSLLLVIPGIVKSYSYAMSYYVKVDHPEYGWKACVDESIRLMRGHKWELFMLDLSFIGWYIVGSLCLGVGILWVTPYLAATRAQFYESIRLLPESL